MKLRITGTRAECADAVEALRAGFVLREMSEFYPNRGGSVLGRVYVDAEPTIATPIAATQAAATPIAATPAASSDAGGERAR